MRPERTPRLHPSVFWFPVAALFLLVTAIGTDTLGRPLTDEEKKRFGALLREHDYPGMRLVALRFAYKLTKNRVRAQDLMGRADLRLVRSGWDPAKVTLVSCLCRLVWSEWTNERTETATTRKAEQGFMRELEVTEGLKLVPGVPAKLGEGPEAAQGPQWAVHSHEEQALALEASRESRTKASVKLQKLRAMFEKAGDEVNLLWLKLELEGVSDLQKMAADSGRDIAEFYAAAKRRKRAVQRLLANERGVTWSEEES
jgi:hypothetical protein